jgi:hypothetical protein
MEKPEKSSFLRRRFRSSQVLQTVPALSKTVSTAQGQHHRKEPLVVFQLQV